MMSELAEKLFTKSIIHMLLSTSSQLNNKTILIKKKRSYQSPYFLTYIPRFNKEVQSRTIT